MKSTHIKRKGPSKALLKKIVEQRKREALERKTHEEEERKEEERARFFEEKLRKEAEERRKRRSEQKKKTKEKQRQLSTSKALEEKRTRLLNLTKEPSPLLTALPKKIKPVPSYCGPPDLRAPILVFVGHVDAGKTKLLDKIRESTTTREAGGITQGISGTFLDKKCLMERVSSLKVEVNIPGMLLIDTPGHEIFDHLRSRGSDICDMAILVIDITKGVQPQTIECLRFLMKKDIPFLIALTKIDVLVDWKTCSSMSFSRAMEKQRRDTQIDFETKMEDIRWKLMEYGLNADLHTVKGLLKSEKVPMIPVSSISGEGISDLLGWTTLFVQRKLEKEILWKKEVQGTVLEVQKVKGCGAAMDVILVNGRFKIGDEIQVCGYTGVIRTKIRSLLNPDPVDSVYGSAIVRICAPSVEKAVCGSPIESSTSKGSLVKAFHQTIQSLFTTESEGVSVFAPTLGALEALIKLLREHEISISTVGIGNVHLSDVKKVQENRGVMLVFATKIDPKAEKLAKERNIRIFEADIMYHVVDAFLKVRDEGVALQKEALKKEAVFPCKLQILRDHIYHSKNPFIFGVRVIEGVLFPGTPVAIPSKRLVIGKVVSIQKNSEEVDSAHMNEEVSIQIECSKKYIYGRHFNDEDLLLSLITRKSLDILKEHFREEIRQYNVLKLLRELKDVYKL